jgi:hypothetical protein
VVTADGRHLLIDSGPLPEAVAASAAIPFIFEAVDVPGAAAAVGLAAAKGQSRLDAGRGARPRTTGVSALLQLWPPGPFYCVRR